MPGSRAATALAGMAVALFGLPGAALAQRASENAVTASEDAFGTSVGTETTGIYTERDTRGFSPLKAGNVRIDGIYYDPVAPMSGRLRAATTIRVGFAAADFPFVAPTGISDHQFKRFPEKFGNSFAAMQYQYGGKLLEWDLRLPIVADHLAMTGGFAWADTRQSDGTDSRSWGATVRPIVKVGGMEISPFASIGRFYHMEPRPLAVVASGHLPEAPARRRLLAQDWAVNRQHNELYGMTFKASVTPALSLRAGLFHSLSDRKDNYSEIFAITDAAGHAVHRLLADPVQEIHSTSGEALAALRLGGGKWTHRLFAGYRARARLTETGGSSVHDFGTVDYGEEDPHARPFFTFGPTNAGRVRQSSMMAGYIGRLDGVGQINLGLQRARYRATFRDGRTRLVDRSSASAWLYNASALVELSRQVSLYAGTQRGLEDSGQAPENAANRNEQLPATRTTQYEGGLRWRWKHNQLVVNLFQITKPYFAFDAGNRYVGLGDERHRGVEASLAGHFAGRLDLVAGAVLMKPQVTGPARAAGLVGKRPAGTPSLYARIDANYRTDLIGGITPTASLIYTGKRAASSRPFAFLGDRQLMVPGFASVDLGFRKRFHIGKVDASLRAVVQNVFDAKSWSVIAANVVLPEDRRRFSATLAVDF